MSTVSTRTTTITFTGDVTATLTQAAAQNLASPGSIHFVNLASGANTITVPPTGATTVSVTIIPPAGNTVALTLKGIAGDTGLPLHLTDPSTIALAAGVTSFVLNAAAAVTGVRLIWS
jgi:hypothetical protein